MNAPSDRTRVRRADRDLWSSWHADCTIEPFFTREDEARFVLGQHGGHGPGCARYTAAAAFLDRVGTSDYE